MRFLRRRVGQQLKRRLDGLQIFSCEQDDVILAVLGDVDPLVGTADQQRPARPGSPS